MGMSKARHWRFAEPLNRRRGPALQRFVLEVDSVHAMIVDSISDDRHPRPRVQNLC